MALRPLYNLAANAVAAMQAATDAMNTANAAATAASQANATAQTANATATAASTASTSYFAAVTTATDGTATVTFPVNKFAAPPLMFLTPVAGNTTQPMFANIVSVTKDSAQIKVWKPLTVLAVLGSLFAASPGATVVHVVARPSA